MERKSWTLLKRTEYQKESTLRGDKMHKYLEDALHGKQSLDFEVLNDNEKNV